MPLASIKPPRASYSVGEYEFIPEILCTESTRQEHSPGQIAGWALIRSMQDKICLMTALLWIKVIHKTRVLSKSQLPPAPSPFLRNPGAICMLE